MSWLYHCVIEGVKFNSEFILEDVEENAARGIWKILFTQYFKEGREVC